MAITFDDGYADNLYFAKPILERHSMPATVFITGLNIGSSSEFWWDELERILLQPGKLPGKIQLTVSGKLHTWDLDEASDYSQKDFDQHRGWNVLDATDPGQRQTLYRSLCQLLHPLQIDECQVVLEELRSDRWHVPARPGNSPRHDRGRDTATCSWRIDRSGHPYHDASGSLIFTHRHPADRLHERMDFQERRAPAPALTGISLRAARYIRGELPGIGPSDLSSRNNCGKAYRA